MNQQIGLFYCFLDFDAYCYDIVVEQLLGFCLLAVCLQQIVLRLQEFHYSPYKRKDNLYYLILVSTIALLLYNIEQNRLVIAYFIETYCYYLFLVYLVYYFARKTIKLKTINPESMYQITVYCYSLALFFSLFLLWNIIDYSLDPSEYNICQKQIFHIVRLIGFLIDLVLVIVAHILNYLIKKSLTDINNLILTDPAVYIKKVNRRRWKFWALVMITFLGQLLYFIQDIYFIVKGTDWACNILNNLESSQDPWQDYFLYMLLQIFEFYLPYAYTIYVFWRIKQPKSQVPSMSIEIEADNYRFGQQKDRLSPPTYTTSFD